MSKHVLVKDTGVAVKVYRGFPKGVVDKSLYTKADASTVESILAEFRGGYLLEQLNSNGIAVMGRKNTLKKTIRAALKNGGNSSANNGGATKHPVKGSEEAKAKMAKVRAARGKNRQSNNVELTLATPPSDDDINAAREHAKATGDWSRVERILDAKYGS